MTFSTFDQVNSLNIDQFLEDFIQDEAQQSTSTAAKGRNTYYHKRKAEKKALKSQVTELTSRLKQLQEQKQWASENGVLIEPVNSAWKTHLDWNLCRLQASEERQRFLQAAVNGKNELIYDLVGLARQYVTTAQSLYSGMLLQPDDKLVYDMIIHELDGVYKQTDKALNDSRIGSTEDLAVFDRATPTIQIGWQKFFPFGFRKTSSSMWMLSSLLHRQEAREEFKDVEDPENTVALKFRFTKRMEDGERGSLVHRFVKRRFSEKTREVCVWKSSLHGDGVFRGMQLDGTGWGVFHRAGSGSGTFGQTCVRQTRLHQCSANKTSERLARMFDEFVHDMVRENYRETTRMVEELLASDES